MVYDIEGSGRLHVFVSNTLYTGLLSVCCNSQL